MKGKNYVESSENLGEVVLGDSRRRTKRLQKQDKRRRTPTTCPV
jgi:hypothetical protein